MLLGKTPRTSVPVRVKQNIAFQGSFSVPFTADLVCSPTQCAKQLSVSQPYSSELCCRQV